MMLNDSFAVSCAHLELREEGKEDYAKVGEIKAGVGLHRG